MNELLFYHIVLGSLAALALVTFPVLFRISAPYGRYTRERFGPTLDRPRGPCPDGPVVGGEAVDGRKPRGPSNKRSTVLRTVDRRVAWVLMEAPSALGIVLFFLLGNRHGNSVAIAFLVLWLVHYGHRAFIFPFRLRGETKRATLLTAVLGVVFNFANVYVNGRYLFTLSAPYPISWFWDPRFLVGAALFALGFAINFQSDTILINLRGRGEGGTGYRIPEGGLFRWVSCPNYLGELVEWSGWAVATWALPGLVFALWTAANLGPRARTHHQWYRQRFPGYPTARRALIPFVF